MDEIALELDAVFSPCEVDNLRKLEPSTRSSTHQL